MKTQTERRHECSYTSEQKQAIDYLFQVKRVAGRQRNGILPQSEIKETESRKKLSDKKQNEIPNNPITSNIANMRSSITIKVSIQITTGLPAIPAETAPLNGKKTQKDIARALRVAGKSYGQIAELLGRGKGTIHRWLCS